MWSSTQWVKSHRRRRRGGGGGQGGGALCPHKNNLEARNSAKLGEGFGQNAGRIRAKFGQKVEEQK